MALPASRQATSSLSLRPASIPPTTRVDTSNPSSADERQANTRTRGRRGGRGGRGANGAANSRRDLHNPTTSTSHRVTTTGRRFGGQLTAPNVPDTQSNDAPRLNARAPDFVPGHQSRTHNTNHVRNPRSAAPSRQQQGRPRQPPPKSTASNIAARTHEDISNGVYECAICTSEITRKSRVWSCRTCWTVFHLSCVKTWSKNEGSSARQQPGPDADVPPPRQWRCPGCNLAKDSLPSNYNCWCEKEMDPKSTSGIPPHSCGQTCGRPRLVPKACPHPCDLTCHAGPCPPCTHKGPSQSCFCGKKSTNRRCIDTDYENGWSCGEVCGDLLPCGEHICQLPCHEGLCGSCEVQIPSRCYCGKIEKPLACSERGAERQSIQNVEGEGAVMEEHQWKGSFHCHTKCDRLFDCGKHSCEKGCHPKDLNPAHCPLSTDVVGKCPCGKTLLSDISTIPRSSCDSPIPNCDKTCLKPLPCGHACQQSCHLGTCMPCLATMIIPCRCGRVESLSICHQGTVEPPQCIRCCRAALNCGRHECGERCCPGERKATERQATKRKLRPLGVAASVDNTIEAEHICTRACGRPLKCGNHSCQELCHKGPCGTCREAIFDDISCHCGRTVLQPPLPCGTPPPVCRFPCNRPSGCGHPKVAHNCHGDGEDCPKCPFLMEKSCLCGKKTLKNQPCWLNEPRCGEVCGKKLRCGSHLCRKTCHQPGDCEDASKPCKQPCGKAKRACGHPCEEPCHAPSTCREDKPCQIKMFATCDCQHLKQEMRCNASKVSEGNTKKQLPCDDECARLQRNQKLALALNVDPDSHKDLHIPYSTDTLKMFKDNVKWCQTQERELRVFAIEEDEKRLRFKPMTSYQRSFLHYLAEDFGLDSESMDPEPHRHVCIFKTPRFVMAPKKTLAECVKIRAGIETPSSEQEQKLSGDNTPFNGFVLTGLPFGILLDEVHANVRSVLGNTSVLAFDAAFLPSEEIVLKARPASTSTSITAPAMATKLKSFKTPIAEIVATKKLAQSIFLCTLDDSLNIVRREQDSSNVDGWSKVAAKGGTPRSAPAQAMIGSKSVYTVLGSKLKEAKRKKEEEERRAKEEVVEDWEAEAQREEQVIDDRLILAEDVDHNARQRDAAIET